MKNLCILLVIILISASCGNGKVKTGRDPGNPGTVEPVVSGNVDFSNYFLDKTMRLDYYHTGTAAEEHFSDDRIVSDGIWSGSKTILIDELRLGSYFFEVLDRDSKILLYSRGFGSIFGEWQTIPEARTEWGTYHESLRFPWPLKPVIVLLQKRDSMNRFNTIWSTEIDPASRRVNSADLVHTNRVDVISENGPADKKVDLVILGDGYSADEMDKFRKDAARLSGFLMNTEPFRSHASDFNIRAIETPAGTTGVNKPHPGVFRRTPLSVSYGSFDSERYALSFDNKTIRDVASAVPYDLMVIIMNEKTYGGGGIYNLYTTVSADNKYSEYIMIHEMGHHIAGLADEYYTSAVSYEVPEVKVEPWETNITALFDRNNLKWKDQVVEGTPVPTPWNKDDFDREGYAVQKKRDSLRAAKVPESLMEDLFKRQMDEENRLFSKEKYRDRVGAFEGAGYLTKGLYRPQLDCIMFTRHLTFCKVCSRSIENVINQYNR